MSMKYFKYHPVLEMENILNQNAIKFSECKTTRKPTTYDLLS